MKKKKKIVCVLSNTKGLLASFSENCERFKVQGSLLFVTYTIIQSIISSEMQVELKKNTA